jgi:Asp-tRNA(Asn)/Glu-tRNA(Gln) amidotransferase A subunit family amidase
MPRSCCRRSPVTRDPASADRPVPDYRAGLASSDLKGARLGIPRSMFERDCPASGPMRGAFDAAVEVLRGLGAAIDAILVPTCSDPAPVLGELGPYFDNRRPMYMRPFNLTGQPALSLCNGFDDTGLPLSLQIVGRHFDEATVLRIGHAYERATPWRERRPQL